MVSTVRMLHIFSGSIVSGFCSRMAKSAYLPGVMEPLTRSSKLRKAAIQRYGLESRSNADGLLSAPQDALAGSAGYGNPHLDKRIHGSDGRIRVQIERQTKLLRVCTGTKVFNTDIANILCVNCIPIPERRDEKTWVSTRHAHTGELVRAGILGMNDEVASLGTGTAFLYLLIG